MKQILLLEDEESLRRGISFKLEKEGYQVFSTGSVREGKMLFSDNSIQLIICDINLEDGNGIDFCRSIRSESEVRFVFLTAMDQEVDMVMGYEAGADDYITKPFSLSVLISKVTALFRRLEGGQTNIIKSGSIVFWVNEMKLLVKDEEVSLTKNEWKLLQLFMEHPRQILSKGQILEQVFDMDGDFVDDNTVAVNIRRLRGKIESDASKPEYIKNIRGMGYRWDKESSKTQ